MPQLLKLEMIRLVQGFHLGLVHALPLLLSFLCYDAPADYFTQCTKIRVLNFKVPSVDSMFF